jgi:hypothetical protein
MRSSGPRVRFLTRILAVCLAADLGAVADTFTPPMVAGLGVWLRADSLTNAPGTIVTNWPDSSGNNYNATNANPAASPTRISTTPTAANARGCGKVA